MQTEHLVLRPWQEEDFEPFAALNADPRVMEYFPSPLSRSESDALAKRAQEKIAERGWGLWAVGVPGVADFIGFIGLIYWDKKQLPTHFTPAYEVRWRLAFDHWGKGYATEGAKAAFPNSGTNWGEIHKRLSPTDMRMEFALKSMLFPLEDLAF